MRRKTIGTARYGLIFHDLEMVVVYAVALRQAISYAPEKPLRVICFEGDMVTPIDAATLDETWTKSLINY